MMKGKKNAPPPLKFNFNGPPTGGNIGAMNTDQRYMWNFREAPTSGKLHYISKRGQ